MAEHNSLYTVEPEDRHLRSASRISLLAFLMLSVLQGADGRLVTSLLVSGACWSRTRQRPALYRSASLVSVQSASSVSRRCWMSASILAELIFLRFLELTTRQWVSDLFSTVKPTMASWSEKEVLSTLRWETDPLFSFTTIRSRM